MTNYAPIVLFVYNRLEHTKKTVESLQQNFLASDSILFIYADFPKSESQVEAVNEVRRFVAELDGFQSINVIERSENWGLARSIVDGVTTVVNEYGRVIVLEDDMITSPQFLTYMNNALNRYEYEKKVWHVTGANIAMDTKGLEDVFFSRLMNCWGWATWADRWGYFEKDAPKLVNTWDKEKIKRFNLDGACDMWDQVKRNYSGRINTWAVFWGVTIFEHGGLCLNPTIPYVENIGHDGSGENCIVSDDYQHAQLSQTEVSFPKEVVVSSIAELNIKNFYLSLKRPFLIRMYSFLKRNANKAYKLFI